MKNIVFETRADYVELLELLCKPLKKYYSEHHAFLNLGSTGTHYGVKITGLEGFARVLWGLVPFWKNGGSTELDDCVVDGIRHGSDPKDAEYWGNFPDGSQAFVEMAPFGYGLLMAPEKIWEPLCEQEKENLNQWLLQINSHFISDNNWLFFRVLVNCGLKKVGGQYDAAQMETDLNRIDEFYLGDGWYSDGETKQIDYYIGFAMHFYGLVYAQTMGEEDPVRAKRFKERAEKFAEDYIYWFGARGEALPYGRSLTYRFAQASFWSALAYCNMPVFSWSVLKGLIDRHFRYWFSNPILDAEDKLTIGYLYPTLNCSEGYNSPCGVYWAFKTLLILALPEEHDFWKAQEEELPELEAVRVLKHPGMIVQRDEHGYVTALASGQEVKWHPVHDAEKYEKFAYSSYFGFQVPRSYFNVAQLAPDNMLAFYSDGYYHVRRQCEKVEISKECIRSVWSPCKNIRVETTLTPRGNGHIREHRIVAEEAVTAVEGGFALAWDEVEEVTGNTSEKGVRLETLKGKSEIQLLQGCGIGKYVFCEANINVNYPRTVLPYMEYEIPKGKTVITVYVEGIPK